jgi:hypothetical protein
MSKQNSRHEYEKKLATVMYLFYVSPYIDILNYFDFVPASNKGVKVTVRVRICVERQEGMLCHYSVL